MDEILQKLTINYVRSQLAKYSKKEDVREYALEEIVKYMIKIFKDKKRTPSIAVEDVIEHMFRILDVRCGIDVDYTFSDDIQDQADNIITKWEAIKSGVDDDMLDILDI